MKEKISHEICSASFSESMFFLNSKKALVWLFIGKDFADTVFIMNINRYATYNIIPEELVK